MRWNTIALRLAPPGLLLLTLGLTGCELTYETWAPAKAWPKSLVGANLETHADGTSTVIADVVYDTHEIRRMRFDVGEAAAINGSLIERSGDRPGQPLYDPGPDPRERGKTWTAAAPSIWFDRGVMTLVRAGAARRLRARIPVRWDSPRPYFAALASPVTLLIDLVCSPLYLFWEVQDHGRARDHFLPWVRHRDRTAPDPECDRIAAAARNG